jgi:hypothetical protein
LRRRRSWASSSVSCNLGPSCKLNPPVRYLGSGRLRHVPCPPLHASTCSPHRIGILWDFHRPAYMTYAKSSHLQRRTNPQRPSRSLVRSRRAHRYSYVTRMGVFALSRVTRVAWTSQDSVDTSASSSALSNFSELTPPK